MGHFLRPSEHNCQICNLIQTATSWYFFYSLTLFPCSCRSWVSIRHTCKFDLMNTNSTDKSDIWIRNANYRITDGNWVCPIIGGFTLATAGKQLLGLVSACAIENGVSHLSSACKKSLLLHFVRSNHEQYTAYTGQTCVLLASKLTRPVA